MASISAHAYGILGTSVRVCLERARDTVNIHTSYGPCGGRVNGGGRCRARATWHFVRREQNHKDEGKKQEEKVSDLWW